MRLGGVKMLEKSDIGTFETQKYAGSTELGELSRFRAIPGRFGAFLIELGSGSFLCIFIIDPAPAGAARY